MFFVELVIGLGIGAVIGSGARIFVKEGGIWNPAKNLGKGFLDAIDREAEQRGRDINFDGPDDLEII